MTKLTVTLWVLLVSSINAAANSEDLAAAKEPSNSPPMAVDDTVLMHGASKAVLRIYAIQNDFDRDGDRLNFVSASARYGTVITADGGLMSYLPNETATDDVISYRIGDGHGGEASAQAKISIKK